jgi:cell division protein FtsB|tara:strand:+ start:948 stop:1136 length:189 start_codon:yes stop_codon:yes gene_type:complete
MQSYLKDNMVHIITLIFLAGMGYAEFRIMQMEIETIEQRLDKKIKIINALEERIDYLEDKIN